MTRIEIEERIVAHLKSALPDLLIEATPDDPDAYDGKAAGGCILVRYNNSTPEAPINPRSKERRTARVYTLFCGAKSLRRQDAHHGAIDLLEAAEAAIDGFAIELGRERYLWFAPVGDSLYAEMNKVWWYALVISGTHIYNKD